MSKNFTFRTAGGRILCIQCQAKAKSTKQQCRRPATRGKSVCRLHGGASTGPKTQQGRQRCAQARLVHGQETIAMRNARSRGSARLAVLEAMGFALGMMTGTRTRGPKPRHMAAAYPELRAAVQRLIREKL